MKINKEQLKIFFRRQWPESRWLIFFAFFVVLPVKSSIADWNWVPTGSMNPTILEGDLVYVNKLAYDLRVPLALLRISQWSDPQHGDIAVFFSPENNMRLVKRVVGLPGDKVEMKNNRLFVNGRPLTYSPVEPQCQRELAQQVAGEAVFAKEDLCGVRHLVMGLPYVPALRNFPEITIPDGQYLMMGDNRDNSRDSRYFGFVERKNIVGKATAVVLSFNKLDKFQPRLERFFTRLL